MTIRLTVLIVATMMVDFTFGATFVTQMRESGLSPLGLGLILGASTLVSALFEAPAGSLADRYGVRLVLSVGLFIWGIGLIAFSMSSEIWGYAASMSLWAIGLAFYSGAGISLAVNYLKQREGPRANTRRLIRASQVSRWVGAAMGASTVLIFGNFGPDSLTLYAGFLLLLGSLWVWTTWPNVRVPHEATWLRTLRTAIRESADDPSIRFVVLLDGLVAIPLAVVIFSWQPIAKDILNIPVTSFGFLFLALTIAAAVGAMSERFLPSGTASGPAAIGLAFLAALSLSASLLGGMVGLVALVISEFVVGAAISACMMLSQTTFSDARRTTLTSIQSTFSVAMMAVTELGFGLIWNSWDVAGALATSAVITAGASVFMMYLFVRSRASILSSIQMTVRSSET